MATKTITPTITSVRLSFSTRGGYDEREQLTAALTAVRTVIVGYGR